MLQLMTRATVAAVQRNTSVVASAAFDLNILDMAAGDDSHAAALGLVNSMDVIFPTAWESHDRTQARCMNKAYIRVISVASLSE